MSTQLTILAKETSCDETAISILQSENGFLGLGPAPEAGNEDPLIVNAGGQPVSIKPGGTFFDSATSFMLIRGGHVDVTVLGALQVDEEGSLAKVLSILSFYHINLTKIQSLPIIGREWEYQFYVDFKFADHERYKQSLVAIRPLVKEIRTLGEYVEGITPVE